MTYRESDTLTDPQLLELSQKGDHNAFGELVRRHYRGCVNLATYILKNRAEAEDEVQKACWKAFKHLDQYQGEAEFFTWLLRIVVNECRMLMRAKKRTRFVYIDGGHSASEGRPAELLSPIADPEYDLGNHEMIEVLRTEIRRIPRLFRQVILLRDVEGLTLPEVAGRLEITVPAAKSRLLRARSELRARVIRRCGARNKMPLFSQYSLPAKPAQRPGLVAS